MTGRDHGVLIPPLSLALAGLFLIGWAPPARGARALPDVESIEILGAEHVSPGRVRDLMRTRSKSFWRPFSKAPYRRDILLEDLTRIESYYRNQGYLSATTELLAPEPGVPAERVHVVIKVTEGPLTRVLAVAFAGHRAVKQEVLIKAVQTTAGEPYSENRVALDRLRLIELYADRGRPYTLVSDSTAIDSLGARVVFLIEEAPGTRVRTVDIEGATSTKEYVVRREVTLERGDLLRRTQVLKSREQLLETGLFRDARVQPALVDSTLPPPLMDLHVSVVERKMGWMLGGIGYNSSNQVRFSGEVGHRNMFGNAQRLVARGRVALDADAIFDESLPSVAQSGVELSFVEPWLLSTRTLGSATVFRETSRLPTVQTGQGGPVRGTGTEAANGIALAAERRFGIRSRLRSTLQQRWVTQEYQLEGGADSTRKFVARSVNFLVERDRRDNPFDPLVGSFQNVFTEISGEPSVGPRTSSS